MSEPAALPVRPARAGRGRAFAIHLGLSALAVGALALAMWLFWYPPPYFMHDGGWRVLRIIVLVDVVAGPLLTLLVFDRAKKELRRDLAVIVLLQVAAFAGGAWVMHANRPAFVVFAGNALQVVSWRDLRADGGDLAQPESLARGRPAPVFAYLELPADRRERQRLLDAAARANRPIAHHGERYRQFDHPRFEEVARGATDIDALARDDASVAAELARVRAAHPGLTLVFLPVECRDGIIMLVFDRATLGVVDWMT